MPNTIGTKKISLARSKGTGDFGDSGEAKISTNASFPQVIAGIVDQFNRHWFKIGHGPHECWLNTLDLAQNGHIATRKLESAGIIQIMPRSLRKLAQQAEGWSQFGSGFVMDRAGWYHGSYLHGGGMLITAGQAVEQPIIVMNAAAKFASSGSHTDWKMAFTPFLKGQDVLLVALGYGLLGPLLDVIHGTSLAIANPIAEWCGASSTGKTTGVIKLPGSLWGYSHGSEIGFGETWHATAGGISLLIEHHNCGFLGLDEAHLASDEVRQRAKIIANAVHIIEKGKPKTTQITGVVDRAHDVVCVSTSNDALRAYLDGTAESKDSVVARLVTFNVPKRPHGILKIVPDGYTSSGEAVDAINRAVTAYYGASSIYYLRQLVEMRKNDHQRLLGILERRQFELLRRLGIDPNDGIAYRRAKPYALAYAATHLGRLWGVLPKKGEVGSYLKAFEDVWEWTKPQSAGKRLTPSDALRAYVAQHRRKFQQASAEIKLSDAEFEACPGFLHSSRKGKELLIAPTRFQKALGFTKAETVELKRMGVLIGEAGKVERIDTKRLVRRKPRGVGGADRVIVLRLEMME
ncbi:DUF927 domain-containing protein [Aestuariivirga sp.]|uniref:DUF927 domain-containing protein n=1 Tax=Aestuariivirga sp. TaxID=2650926 RepID=UPI0039E30BB8